MKTFDLTKHIDTQTDIAAQQYDKKRWNVHVFVEDLIKPLLETKGHKYEGYYYHGMLGQHLIMIGDGTFSGKQTPLLDFVQDNCPEHTESVLVLFPYEKTSEERLAILSNNN